jgi:hypothetical protein
MDTFSGFNPDRTDMRLGSRSAELQNTAVLWCQRLNVRQPFLSQSIYVPGCLAISVLAPRPLVRALACV